MNKETILRNEQSEKDETEAQANEKAMRYAYIVLVLSAAVFAFIRILNDQPVMDYCAAVCFSVFAGRIYCFAKTKSKSELAMAVIAIALGVTAMVRFFMGH